MNHDDVVNQTTSGIQTAEILQRPVQSTMVDRYSFGVAIDPYPVPSMTTMVAQLWASLFTVSEEKGIDSAQHGEVISLHAYQTIESSTNRSSHAQFYILESWSTWV
jgi:hypothetical protein